MKSPRSTIRIFAPLPASSRAMVPPPAPLPMMMMSNVFTLSGSGLWAQGAVNAIHQLLIFDGALEAHLRRAAGRDRFTEIAIHRLVAANVAETGKDDARESLAAHQHHGAVRLEGDDALASHQLRQAQAFQHRRDLARVVQRT